MAQAIPNTPFVVRACFRPAHRGQSGSEQEIKVPVATLSGIENYVRAVKIYNQKLRALADIEDASTISVPLPVQPADPPSGKFCYDVQIDVMVATDVWVKLVPYRQEGSGGIYLTDCTPQCKFANTLFVDTPCKLTSNAPRLQVLHIGIRLATSVPIFPRIFILATGRIVVSPLKHEDRFNFIALPPELQLKVLYNAIERSKGQTELIDGGVVENGKRKPGKIVDERFPMSKAQDRANILLALDVIFPKEMKKYFSDRQFKFGSTSDAANFLQGIGPVGRGLLRNVKICSWLQKSGQDLFKFLVESQDLQRLHITAICIGEAGCRANHTWKAVPNGIPLGSRPGTYFYNQLALGIRAKRKRSHRRMIDLLSQRDILTFDEPVIAYGKDFGDYLEDGNPRTNGRSKWIARRRDRRDFVESVRGLGVRCRILEE